MFNYTLNPVLMSFGGLEIRYYGLVYGLGVLLFYYIIHSKRNQIPITKNKVDNLLLYIVLGMVVFSRIFYFLFEDISSLFSLDFFMLWKGGMSFFGGLLGSVVGALFFLKDWRKLLRLGDMLVVPLSFLLAFGRIANFINGELVGRVSDVAWCVAFPFYEGCRHPYQLYSSISLFFLGFLLWFLARRKWNSLDKIKKREGVLFFQFVFFYSLLRIVTDFFREDYVFGFFTGWQWFSVGTLIFSLIALIYFRKKSS